MTLAELDWIKERRKACLPPQPAPEPEQKPQPAPAPIDPPAVPYIPFPQYDPEVCP
jgi:hypothetical protein